MKTGRLFVVSGPSGAGKGTICKELLNTEDLDLSISMTTRKPRGKEVEGISYYFVSHEEFQKTIDEGGLLEWAEIYNNRYGTPKAPVLEKLAQGRDVIRDFTPKKPVLDKLSQVRDVILEIEMQGAMQVKKSYPKSVLIFVLPPSISELKKRLIARGTETEEQIELRTRTTIEEIKTIKDYSYFIVNDDLETALSDARTIIRAEHLRVEDQAEDIIHKYESEGK